MSAVCTCSPGQVVIKQTEAGDDYCETCGFWYSPEYGSGAAKPYHPAPVVTRVPAPAPKPSPYDPCSCGSGKKRKWCCAAGVKGSA